MNIVVRTFGMTELGNEKDEDLPLCAFVFVFVLMRKKERRVHPFGKGARTSVWAHVSWEERENSIWQSDPNYQSMK